MKRVPVGRLFALVDDGDFDAVAAYKWRPVRPRNVTYALANLPRRDGHGTLYMHRLILGASGHADHINGDGLDNRRSNLRVASYAQNAANVDQPAGASRFKGVSRSRSSGRWRAYIRTNYRQVHIGTFDTEEDAARAYDRVASAMWGEFARLNGVA